MQQLMEFAGNHPLLVAGFVAVLLLLLWTEFGQRGRGFRVLGTGEAVRFINQENARVIDVSPAADYQKGHIVGAHNIGLSRIEASDREVAKMLDAPLLVTCRNGPTALNAAAKLVKLGAREVAVIRGGMTQWMADNYPVARK